MMYAKKDAGCIAVLGGAMMLAQAAMAAPGDMDTTFATTGVVYDSVGPLPSAPPFDSYNAVVALQTDNKAVVAASACNFRLTRYNVDGTRDATFGGDGVVMTEIGWCATPKAIVVQTNGKIVVAGTFYVTDYMFNTLRTTADGIVVARYEKNGALDTTFGGGDGVAAFDVRAGYYDTVTAIALQRDGKLLVAGQSYRLPIDTQGSDGLVLRVNGDGTLDKTFGTSGRLLWQLGSPSVITSVALQLDGRIVVGGHVSGTPYVMRLVSGGGLDTTFATTGGVAIPVPRGGSVSTIAVQPDGKILAGGGAVSASGSGVDFMLTRVLPNGLLDGTFGTGGVKMIDMTALRGGTAGSTGDYDVVYTLAAQPDGNILLGGESGSSQTNYFTVARLLANGSLDASYGAAGFRTLRGSYANGVALYADGRCFASGMDRTGSVAGNYSIAARLRGTPWDLLPDTLTFAAQTNAAIDVVAISNSSVIAGLTAGTAVPIEVSGGSYSINGRPFTTVPGWVRNGDNLRLRHKTSKTYGSKSTTKVAIGGLRVPNNSAVVLGKKIVATFSSTTQSAP